MSTKPQEITEDERIWRAAVARGPKAIAAYVAERKAEEERQSAERRAAKLIAFHASEAARLRDYRARKKAERSRTPPQRLETLLDRR